MFSPTEKKNNDCCKTKFDKVWKHPFYLMSWSENCVRVGKQQRSVRKMCLKETKKNWTTSLFSIEMGCQGFIGNSSN